MLPETVYCCISGEAAAVPSHEKMVPVAVLAFIAGPGLTVIVNLTGLLLQPTAVVIKLLLNDNGFVPTVISFITVLVLVFITETLLSH